MTGFWQRLKQRKIVQWALAWVAFAFALLQGVDIVAQQFGWPEGVRRGITIALVVGFFVVLVLAWYHGERGRQRIGSVELLIIALLLAVGGGFLWRFAPAPQANRTIAGAADLAGHSRAPQPAAAASVPAKSIAVLPFENLSTDKANAYFADGIQDEILTALAKIGDLKVISRTSTRRYASAPDNLPDIARQLGVATILEGSVQKAGDRVRVNVQLIDARSDNHVWAETYDRKLDDVFAVESEVAEKIASSLQAAITGDERHALDARPTANGDAYAAYLRARALLGRSAFDRGTVEATIAAYRQAVTLDPGFALAWAGLVRQNVWMYWEGFDPTPARLAMARTALDHATALAPQAPLVQAAKGWYDYYGRYDFVLAQAAFRAAQRGLPNDASVWLGSGLVARRLGDYAGALKDFERARTLDPNSVTNAVNVAEILLGQRRFDEADSAVDYGLALDGGSPALRRMKLEVLWNQMQIDAVGRLLAMWRTDSALGLANRATQALYQRNFAAAAGLFERAIAASSDAAIYASYGEYIPAAFDWRLQQALCEGRLGHAAKATALYREVQAEASAQLAGKPANVHVEVSLRLALGQALAGLGLAKEAVAEGRHAVTLIPESRDAWEGQQWQQYLARIHAINKDEDDAIPLISHLLATPGYHPLTVARLRLDPVWDPFRQDPRFEALLKQYAADKPAPNAVASTPASEAAHG